MIKPSILEHIAADIDQLSLSEQLLLMEKLAQAIRERASQDARDAALVMMADDPEIQREMHAIADEFAVTEADGLISETQYQHLVEILDSLIDMVGSDETHPLASLMDVIGTLIERYEDENVPEMTDL